MKALLENIKLLVALGATAFGIFFFLDSRHASSGEFQELKTEVQVNRLHNTKRNILDDVYYYKKLVRQYPRDEDAKDRLKESEEELKKVREQIQQIEVQ